MKIKLTVLSALSVVSTLLSVATAHTQNKPVIGYAGSKLTDPFMIALTHVTREEAKAQEVKLLAPTNANGDADKQVTDVRTLLTKQPNALIVAPVDANAIVPAINLANKDGIPVVVVDEAPAGGKIAMVVRADNYGMGVTACKEMGRLLAGSGTVLDLQGALTSTNARDRTDGFADCLKKSFPGIKDIRRPTDWDMAKATSAAQVVLSTGQLNGIYMASDFFLPGVAKVLRDAGRWTPAGAKGHMALIGIDGTPDALKAIRDGYEDATVAQPLNLYAKYSVYYAKEAAEGKAFAEGPTDHNSNISLNKFNQLSDGLPAPLVNKGNAANPDLWGNK
jgi:ribose transport system substrate-binding protein